MTALDQANAAQREASNPATSAFVSASAGSGKTKLLTDRLLRLMLDGTPPEKILCLTYTKAAAAEMTIRLNRRLGEWVVMTDEKLNLQLAEFSLPASASYRATARKLFADVLDLPGGMRINTIHAFCQSLLRRFPLEAELSPHFALEDDYEAATRLREAREQILADPAQRGAIFLLAAETNEQEFAAQTKKFAGETALHGLLRDFNQAGVVEMQRAALGATELDDNILLRRAVTWAGEAKIKSVLQLIASSGPPKAAGTALERLDWLSGGIESRAANWEDWRASFFTAGEKPSALSTILGKKLADSNPDACAIVEAEQARITAIEDNRKAASLARLNSAMMSLLAPILEADTTQKSEHATVSYADLIDRTLALLKNPEDVAWVLYKLDGGIDHLLLDEVQDTAPAQWRITDAIAAEFFAGLGAREQKRSIFAVGDPKQSIFSFQGADLHSFESYRAKFKNRALGAGQNWVDGDLKISFRSTASVLALVDAVFAEGAACDGVCPPGTLTHIVSRAGQAGTVSLWPLTKPTEPAPLPAWTVADDYAPAESGKSILGKTIARHIKQTLDAQTPLPSRNRPAAPGDFLILVRHRDELVTAITRACKAEGIPIAGADRLTLTEHQAVSDLLALCDALLLPEDDLAFGQYLASPLGGLSDESLMALAISRPGTLAAALFARRDEREDWHAANDYFQHLRARVDFASPHALLAEALSRGGRTKILRRLGAEAAEPIDELLTEALAFGRRAPASLQNFVFTLRQSGAAIKREAASSGDMVRIMTVHGAKGLQAPIVILPDTTTLPIPRDNLFWLSVPQQDITVPIFCPRADLRSPAVKQAVAENKAAQEQEYNRLLYVALTRAEDELIICGAEGKKALPDGCWYNLVSQGFARLPAETGADGILRHAAAQTAKPDREKAQAVARVFPLPPWAGSAPDWQAAPPAKETTRPEPIAPSRGTEDAAKAAIAASPLGDALATARLGRAAAMAKGRAVHSLLQHLPELPAPDRRPAAAKYLAQTGLALPETAQAQITDSILQILETPALAPLFAPGSRAEVPLAGVLGDVEIGGLVDRLAIHPDRILVADYKTDRAPPATPAAIPPAYLNQLAAYRAILQDIFPGRPVECTLIWTETATPMPIPADLLHRHAPQPPQPSKA
jgi:ATP-dependent helicase/nuclease subunit A